MTIPYVYGSSLVCSKLRCNSFQGRESRHGNYLTVCSRKLIASEDVTKEVCLQIIVVLRRELILYRSE